MQNNHCILNFFNLRERADNTHMTHQSRSDGSCAPVKSNSPLFRMNLYRDMNAKTIPLTSKEKMRRVFKWCHREHKGQVHKKICRDNTHLSRLSVQSRSSAGDDLLLSRSGHKKPSIFWASYMYQKMLTQTDGGWWQLTATATIRATTLVFPPPLRLMSLYW